MAEGLDGILSFPVSPFDRHGEIDLGIFRSHLQAQLAAGPAALFVCCGTGEFFSLGPDEYARLTEAAVQEAAGALPVYAGVGYGVRQARPYLEAAQRAGLSGLLVLPPYLVQAPQAGLISYYRAIAAAAGIPVIIYQRDNVRLTPDTVVELADVPGIAGLKDGLGDLELMTRIRSALRRAGRDEFLLLNGTPTAEVVQPAYAAIGITTYSSAVHCFAPEVAHGFSAALAGGKTELVGRYLDEFYLPFIELRALGAGYAVALVKSAVRAGGLDVGSVRPPLTDPPAELVRTLQGIVDHARSIG